MTILPSLTFFHALVLHFVEMLNNIYLGCFIPLIVKKGTFKLWRLVVWFWQILRSSYIKSTYVINGEFWELSMLWRYPIWKRESPNSRTMCSYVVYIRWCYIPFINNTQWITLFVCVHFISIVVTQNYLTTAVISR